MSLSKTRLYFLIFFSLLELLLFGGLQYGWSSLIFVLKAEGLFENLCSKELNKTYSDETANTTDKDGNSATCFYQDERFNLLFSIAIAALTVANVVSGQLYYKYGVKKIRIFKIFIFVSGALFLGFASKEVPWLVLPGLICVGVGGVSLIIADMQVAVLLKQGSSIYVGLLNGFYDSSVLTQRVVKILYEHGINRLYTYSGIAILMLTISGLCTALFPAKAIDKDNVKAEAVNDVKDIENISSTITKTNDISPNRNVDDQHNQTDNINKNKGDNLGSVIRSRKYIFHVLWLSIMMIREYYFLGSINRIMEQTFNDQNKVSYFTDVMAYTMIGGVASSFFAGQLLHFQNKCCSESLRKVLPLTITCILAVLLSCMTFVSVEESFYVTFILLTIFRSFIFCVAMDFIIDSFPKRYMSILFGLALLVAGIISLLQYVLFIWTDTYHDAVKHVNAVLLVLSCLSLLHPLFLVLDASRTPKMKRAYLTHL